MTLKEMKEGNIAYILPSTSMTDVDLSDNHDDYAYSTVHQLLMAFHDDPGSSILNSGAKPDQTPNLTLDKDTPGGWKGLRSEWRGVLSFDGMQRLDGVWTSSIRGS